MLETYPDKSPSNIDKEIDFRELLHVLLAGKWIIISLTTFASIVSVLYSLSLPNIYESKALLVPVNPSSTITGALGGYGSIAGLAGINFPSGGDEGNSQKALKKIGSLSFLKITY